jgi:hypothetical protein
MSSPPREVVATTLRLSDLVGRRVRDLDRKVGRVGDLVADLSVSPARVTAVDVRARGGRRRYPWAVTRLSHRLLVVEGAPSTRGLAEHELLLRRDLQDTRVYDATAGEPARVGEVWLQLRGDGSLVVQGVETGAAPVLRRLAPFPPTAPEVPDTVRPLREIALLGLRGHRLQNELDRGAVPDLDTDQLAGVLTHLTADRAVELVARLDVDTADAVVARLHPHVRSRVARAVRGPVPGERRRTRRTAGWRRHAPPDRPHR